MRHRFHSICPYFAMFPETFVEKHLAASRFEGIVFDPFCGRGTTVFESLLRGREAAGCDIHPVAACITGAKCDAPSANSVLARIDMLEREFQMPPHDELSAEMDEFFTLCFHASTFEQVLYLREQLRWKTNKVDRFISALSLGALHGESHRSPNYFSNRMPRTISTKPAYSVRWWRTNDCAPPLRDVFEILREMTLYRFRSTPPAFRGKVALGDARYAGKSFARIAGRVTDIITSPPYLDTTNYHEDQWLRLWFLGGVATANHKRQDARHYNKDLYWKFLEEAWSGVRPLLSEDVRVVVRIGGRRLEKAEIHRSLLDSLEIGLGRRVQGVDNGITTSVKRTQANSFRGAKASPTVEHDFCFLVS